MFSKNIKSRHMMKVTLTDGQEFVDEVNRSIRIGTEWVIIDNGYVYYPHHRVSEVHFWDEK